MRLYIRIKSSGVNEPITVLHKSNGQQIDNGHMVAFKHHPYKIHPQGGCISGKGIIIDDDDEPEIK